MPYKDPEKQKAFARAWLRKRRQGWIDSRGGKCVKCGSIERLEVDHIDRHTKVTHSVWSWTQIRRDEELAKCQLLCYVCHQAKTLLELPEWKGKAVHGTHSMYTQGCRCDECREAHSALARKWRADGRKW